jgi:hypothetical protein
MPGSRGTRFKGDTVATTRPRRPVPSRGCGHKTRSSHKICTWIFTKSLWPVCETQERSSERTSTIISMTKDHVRFAGPMCAWWFGFPHRPRQRFDANTKNLLVLVLCDRMGKTQDYYVVAPPTSASKMALPPTPGHQKVLKFSVLGIKGLVVVRLSQFQADKIERCPLPLPVLNTLRQLAGECSLVCAGWACFCLVLPGL